MSEKQPPTISAEEILNAEFEYIASTASQANDDRSSVVSFFVIAVGSPIAAFFGSSQEGFNQANTPALFTGLFLILSILGITTILQLARLRAAWHESMLAMNHMKEFLIQNSDSDISGAFRWSTKTAPAKFKPNSVSFYQALEVALLSGIIFGAFLFFLLLGLNGASSTATLLCSGIGGLLFTGLAIWLYRRMLS